MRLSPESKRRLRASVDAWICKGYPPRRIASLIRDEFGITSRTARKYITESRTRLGEAFRTSADESANPDAVRAQGEHMLLEAYATAKRNKDSKAMQAATVTYMQLHGVAPVQKVDLKITGVADMMASVFAEVDGNGVQSTNPSESSGQVAQ